MRHHLDVMADIGAGPDEVIAVRAVPRTFSGKKLEVPVKRILRGEAPADVATPSALQDPRALEDFAEVARRRR